MRKYTVYVGMTNCIQDNQLFEYDFCDTYDDTIKLIDNLKTYGYGSVFFVKNH